MSITRRLCVLVMTLAAAVPVGAQGSGDAVDRAMRDEMARSMTQLRLGQNEGPYFIAYRVHEVRTVSASASDGSLVSSQDMHVRTLNVDVRVGSYAFDNSNSLGGGMMGFTFGGGDPEEIGFGGAVLPLDDNYVEVRRQIWLATDAAYKQALEGIAGKRAALMNRTHRDSIADFSREDTTLTVERDGPALVDGARVEALVRELSRVRELEAMPASRVVVEASNDRVRYLNSEGTMYVISHPLLAVTASASTQAPDGMPLSNAVRVYTRRVDSLPSPDRLIPDIRAMALGLDSVRSAPVADRYVGPVLFQRRAAAQLFGTVFAPGLTPRRKIVFPNPDMEVMFERMSSGSGATLVDRIGGRVLPDFLSVVDDPTRSVYGSTPVFGGYAVDDDGVRGRPIRVVDGGVLKAVLTTRAPVAERGRSTGSHRGLGASASNLIVETHDGLSDSALTARLLALVKARGLAYGIVVRDLGDASGATIQDEMRSTFMAMAAGGGRSRPMFRAYKVYPDGREEAIRGARLDGLTAESFRDIVAASATATVYTGHTVPGVSAMMAAGGSVGEGLSFRPAVTYVVPSLLFEDVTVSKPNEEFPKPPFSAPPAIGQ